MAGESRIAVLAALVGNLLIALLKLGAGIVARSSSMMAESAHSFSDVGNQILLLIGIRRSAAEPSADHPYGTGKSAYFWPFLVAVILFGVAGGYSLYEGVQKILHPHPLGDIRLALGVLALAFVIESGTLYVAVQQARKRARERGIASVRQFMDENRDATLLTVIVEDSLALVGLPIAAGALLLTVFTGNPIWDGIGSLLIGVLLMGFALFLAYEVENLLVGRGLSKRDLGIVHEILVADAAIDRVLNVKSLYLGPDVVLLGVEVDVASHLTGDTVEHAMLRVERALLAALPDLKFVYLEPRQAATPEAAAEARRVPPHAAHERGG